MSQNTQGTTDLEGTWRLLLFERGGRLTPASENAGVLRVTGEEFTLKSGDYIWASGLVRVDATSSPLRVDFLQPLGPGQWSVQPGIYEVAGDELRLRLAGGGEDRPEQFDSEQGLAVYRKEPE